MRHLPPRLNPGLTAGVFSFVLPIAFVPWFTLPSDTPKWALVALGSIAACALRPRLTVAHLAGLAFLTFAALSLLWTTGPYDGANVLLKLLFLAGFFLIGERLESLRPVWIGLALGFTINSGVAIAQWYGWQGIPTGAWPAGLFVNKNYMAEPAALVLVALVASRLWWFIPGIIPAILPPGTPVTRGAVFGLAVAGICWVFTRSKALGLVLVLGSVFAAAVLLHRGDGGNSMAERALIWGSTVNGLTWSGSGIGSFIGRFPSHAPAMDTVHMSPSHAHNDLIEMVYELGPGALLYLAVVLLALCGPFGAAWLVLAAFLAEGCFGFPLHFPVTGTIAALAAGHLCRGRRSLRDHIDAVRWAAVRSMEASGATYAGVAAVDDGWRDLSVRPPL